MPRYEHTHEGRGEFKSGFKLTLGCLFAILFFFVGIPLILVAGCTAGCIGVGSIGAEAARRAEEEKARAAAQQQPQRPQQLAPEKLPAPPPAKPKPVAVGDVVKLVGDSGFVALADTPKTLELFLKAEADRKEGIVLDFFRAETVVRTPAGSEARIRELGRDAVNVEMTSGPHKGRAGYVPAAAIPKPPEPVAVVLPPKPEKATAPDGGEEKPTEPVRAIGTKAGMTVDWLTMQITKVEHGKAELRSFGRPSQSAERMLVVHFRLKTKDETKRYDYASWGEKPGSENAKATDDLGNVYRPVRFEFGTEVVGRTKSWGVKADSPTEDVLVYESPVPAVKYIDLDIGPKLPGNSGVIFRFRLPRSVWD